MPTITSSAASRPTASGRHHRDPPLPGSRGRLPFPGPPGHRLHPRIQVRHQPRRNRMLMWVLPNFQVGAVHGQHPTGGGLRGHGEYQRADAPGRKRAGGEKTPEPPVNRFGFRGGVRVAGEPDERNGALADDGKHQHRKAGEPGFRELQMGFEEFTKAFQSGVGGLGAYCLSFTTNDLHPWSPFIEFY